MQDDKKLAQGIARELEPLGGHVYYVGGCVRDEVLGRENKDVDVEVHGVDDETLREVLAGFGRVEAVGASFGVYNLHGHTLDIALVDNPSVNTCEAARRRDLTMNALYQDVLTGEVIDHFGGCEDLARGVIRHVDASTFVEDPLRVMRAAQFAARLGMRVDEATVKLCAGIDVAGVASERVLEELKKALLKSERPSRFFEELRRMGQVEPWFAEVAALVDVPQNPVYHPEGDVWVHTMLVLDVAAGMRERASDSFGLMVAALCHDLGKATTTRERDDGRIISYGHEVEGVELAKQLLNRLGASNHLRSYVYNMVELHMKPNALVAQHANQKAYNRMFDRSICPRDLLLLAQADGGANTDVAALEERLARFEDLMARPYVQGRDLLEGGVEPGPLMGEVLRYAHKLRLAGMSKENQLRQCLGHYRSLLREGDVRGEVTHDTQQ